MNKNHHPLTSPFPRRYNDYVSHFRKEFGRRVQKVSVDAGFTCPNRDGLLDEGGCTYCLNNSFSPSYCRHDRSIRKQIEDGIEFHHRRYRRADQFLAYFQAYTNTYGDVRLLEERFREALAVPGIVGLIIGTRPDCVAADVIALLEKLAGEVYLTVELGFETTSNQTLQRIRRGHTWEQSVDAVECCHRAGLRTGAHMMFGLPGETREAMLAQADTLSALPLNTIKFHQLQLIKGTDMVKDFAAHPEDFLRFTQEEYIEFIIDFTERLNPEIVIERFCGEVPPRYLAQAPWGSLRYDQILQRIEQRMEERDTWQGKLVAAFNSPRFSAGFESRANEVDPAQSSVRREPDPQCKPDAPSVPWPDLR